MPVYEYRCMDCEELDQRVGGLDDRTAICAQCGSMMLRLNEDVFQPYFDNNDGLKDVSLVAEDGDFHAERRNWPSIFVRPGSRS
jgi:putative FmdB family regulatory protein